ncbi:MAG: hypothetical protein A2V52_06390 [Actinobacteria bacterium RBG_19FT_COMBO_54_7]|uniref:Uncharacterized protein n=1 Tax=Candidatus Solincola sediminis TaxID=1797199 RepID=A0A1F2WF62_9ACTN|nr:MAG: hypothetical protein A2Y75_09015 [Candidatus Solincola sediminis]OFW57853.1 MAG: hypothetical protein A2W01_05475 [Candidatus Solincola sediminis]OFW68348.1 MAG: hypothetical protein A2V52_06390 [Actinobacteria bacterium RBG_19FT_COMBO_54_7]
MSNTTQTLFAPTEEANHPVEVKCYSGFKHNERPLSFMLSGREFSVMDIEGSWFEEQKDSEARRACFRVRADDGDLYLLSCDENRDDWFLHRVWRLSRNRAFPAPSPAF